MRLDWQRWNVAVITRTWIFVIGFVHDKDGWFWSCDLILCVTDSTGKTVLAEDDTDA